MLKRARLRMQNTQSGKQRDSQHCEQLIAQMGEWGYPVERLD